MKCVIIAVAVVVTILQVASVTVSEGEYTFSLEAVKMLWQALEEAKYREVRGNEGRSSSASQSHMPAVCSDPALPADFIPLCQDPNAEQAFANLENLATMSLTCELCKSAACTGC
ncbi:hypothetical protein NHX12_013255 [Muraenolepis orangiensis]|uniref:Guanylate cyclase activator 2B n=1 Tax=Muraenolepis orangiensis TaxID=630683 RepID=A0A9Q0DG20_9TELE|nr:hypothetical protein NHX12_013255 [Muraenolepis orangiensis]